MNKITFFLLLLLNPVYSQDYIGTWKVDNIFGEVEFDNYYFKKEVNIPYRGTITLQRDSTFIFTLRINCGNSCNKFTSGKYIVENGIIHFKANKISFLGMTCKNKPDQTIDKIIGAFNIKWKGKNMLLSKVKN